MEGVCLGAADGEQVLTGLGGVVMCVCGVVVFVLALGDPLLVVGCRGAGWCCVQVVLVLHVVPWFFGAARCTEVGGGAQLVGGALGAGH